MADSGKLSVAVVTGGITLDNGADVLAYFPTIAGPMESPGFIVLAHWTKQAEPEWITWWVNADTGGASTGHYYETEAEARADFAARITREVDRRG